MDIQQLMNMQGMMGGRQRAQDDESVQKTDTAETIHISSLALLKMLKHCRAGVPLEVMGLMLGKFVDDYTIVCTDVFAMPQSGTQVTVESIDPAYQSEMVEMLQQTSRNEHVIGWYHSHPGFGPWLSSTDVKTQQSMEQQHPRAVALVLDPIQSVRGKVMMDCFRLIDHSNMMMRVMSKTEPRQTTSNVGHIVPHGLLAKSRGLDQMYYAININYKTNELEQKMLLNLYKQKWTNNIKIKDCQEQSEKNQEQIESMINLAKTYTNRIEEETKKSKEELAIKNVGKIDPKRHISQGTDEVMSDNITQLLGMMTNIKTF